MTDHKKKSGKGNGNIVRIIRNIPINIGTFLFGAIFVYMIISFVMYLTADHIESYQVTAGPLARNQTYTALVVRDEKVIQSGTAGYVTYYARENSKVARSGVVYSIGDQQSKASIEELDENDYSRIRSSMAGFSNSFDPNNYYDVYNYKYELQGDILQFSGLSFGEDGQVPQTIGGQTVYTAASDGVIVYSVDGYEDLSLDALHASLFNQKNYAITTLKTDGKIAAGDDVYKLITSEEWSLIIPLTSEQTVQLAGERKTIKVKFLKDDTTMVGDFGILTDEDGGFYAKITFSSGMIRYSMDRFLNVELVTNTESGLKIPLSAIVQKDCYQIPVDFIAKDENGKIGVNKKVERKNKDDSAEFVQATIYGKDADYYYIDAALFEPGEQIIKPDSQETYVFQDTVMFEGVYCINKGYCVFRRVEIIEQNEEYCIVRTSTSYGISQFDHIVRNGESVKEDEILIS